MDGKVRSSEPKLFMCKASIFSSRATRLRLRCDKIDAVNWFKCKQLAPAETWVRVKDFASGEVTRIPARELAPNMVEARVEGIEGTVWVDARQLQQGTLQQEPFSAELRDEIRVIQAAVEEFYPLSPRPMGRRFSARP